MIQLIVKRDGRVVPYDREKIALAVLTAMRAAAEGTVADAARVAESVEQALESRCGAEPPQIELIQDMVEQPPRPISSIAPSAPVPGSPTPP